MRGGRCVSGGLGISAGGADHEQRGRRQAQKAERQSQGFAIEPVYDVVIPNAFTPDPEGGGSGGGNGTWVTGDLSNDVFYPFVRFLKDFRMRIFNRWGELIFESTDLKVGWDGYYRGQISPQDVYVVQTWFRFVDGKTVEKLSDLTLFR